jgi:hypothetical protein
MSDEPPQRRAGPIEWLTVPGRLLLIGTIVGCGGVLYWYFAITLANLPSESVPGRRLGGAGAPRCFLPLPHRGVLT